MRKYINIFSVAGFLVLAVFAAKFLPNGDFVQDVFAVPAAAALLGALFTLVRDDAARQHAQSLQSQNNAFILSATSHMATVSFDKHVAFAEKYVAEVQQCMAVLFQKGPTEDAFGLACRLYAIRRDFAVWETESISKTLNEFEQALQEMGAKTHGLNAVPPSDERSKRVDEVFGILKKILELRDAPENLSGEIVGRIVIQRMRELLGIAELTALRHYYLGEALNRSKAGAGMAKL